MECLGVPWIFSFQDFLYSQYEGLRGHPFGSQRKSATLVGRSSCACMLLARLVVVQMWARPATRFRFSAISIAFFFLFLYISLLLRWLALDGAPSLCNRPWCCSQYCERFLCSSFDSPVRLAELDVAVQYACFAISAHQLRPVMPCKSKSPCCSFFSSLSVLFSRFFCCASMVALGKAPLLCSRPGLPYVTEQKGPVRAHF